VTPEPHGRPGFFISIEGVDGSGKSTQCAALAAALRHEGHDVVVVREPGGTILGEEARTLVLEQRGGPPLDPWAETFLFLAARAQLLAEVIRPAAQRGSVVIADRFIDSTLAYQGAGRGLGVAALRRLHTVAFGDLWPDLTIVLDIGVAAAARRRRAAELPLDRIELAAESFHESVRACFLTLAEAEPQRVVVLDGAQSAAEVSRQILKTVASRLAAALPA